MRIFTSILRVKMGLRPKYLMIDKLTENITLSGRRWKAHGSSTQENSGKEAGSKKTSGKEGSTKEEVMR
jgi:hypothetical protein